jgi:hypothetical protein
MTTDAPNYPIGHTINLVAQVCVALLAIFGILYIVRENKLRSKGKRDHRLEGIDEVKQGATLTSGTFHRNLAGCGGGPFGLVFCSTHFYGLMIALAPSKFF